MAARWLPWAGCRVWQRAALLGCSLLHGRSQLLLCSIAWCVECWLQCHALAQAASCLLRRRQRAEAEFQLGWEGSRAELTSGSEGLRLYFCTGAQPVILQPVPVSSSHLSHCALYKPNHFSMLCSRARTASRNTGILQLAAAAPAL